MGELLSVISKLAMHGKTNYADSPPANTYVVSFQGKRFKKVKIIMPLNQLYKMHTFFRTYSKLWHMLYKSGEGFKRIRWVVLLNRHTLALRCILMGEHGMPVALKIWQVFLSIKS
jgi:hypothetical protein